MISKLRNWFLPLMILCFVLSGFARAEQKIETFMTFSCSSWNSVMNDLKTIGEISSNPSFAALVEGPLQFYIGRDMMKAADLNAPIGLAFQRFEGESADNYALICCFPIKEASTLLDFLTKKMDEDLEFTQREDGVIEWNDMFLKEVNGFTWLLTDERQLPQLDSADPKTFFLMGDGQSLQFTFDPNGFGDLPITISTAFNEGADLALEKEEDESDEEFELRKKLAEEQKNLYKTILESIQMVSMGIGINSAEKTLALNTKVSLIPNSEGTKLLKKNSDVKPLFTGFTQAKGLFRGYGISLNLPTSPELQKLQAKLTLERLQKFFGEEGKTLFSPELMMPILEELAGQTESYSGYILDGKKGAHNLIMASTTGQLAKMREVCENFVKLLKEKAGEKFKDEWFQPNVQAHGMTFSQLTLPTDDLFQILSEGLDEKTDENELNSLKTWIGDSITFAVGGKEDRLYMGIGIDPLQKLGECLNDQPAAHFSEMSIDLREMFRYLEELMVFARENKLIRVGTKIQVQDMSAPGDEEDVEEELKDIAEKADEEAQKDMKKIESLMGVLNELMDGTEKTNLSMTVDSTESELLVQFLGEEGLLKIIGMLPGLILMNAL